MPEQIAVSDVHVQRASDILTGMKYFRIKKHTPIDQQLFLVKAIL